MYSTAQTNFILNIKPLFEMSLNTIIPNLPTYKKDLKYLPEFIKQQIFNRVTKLKYGIHDDEIMNSLIPRYPVKSIDLRSSTITDDTLKAFSKCKWVTYVVLSHGNYRMTSEGLKDFFAFVPHLRTLFILDCAVFTDDVLAALAEHCPLINNLDIGGSSVTDEGMIVLSKCRDLQALNISKTAVTDAGIITLSKGPCGKTLNDLKISSCPVSDAGIEGLVNNCSLLSTLICNNCNIKDMAASGIDRLPIKQLSWTFSFDRPTHF